MRWNCALSLATATLVACGGGSDGIDGGGGGADAAPDAVAVTCGDGVVDPDEACDGASRSCSELGATWTGGFAACRADCRGWDPSACTLANPGVFEAVKPAERDTRWETARCNDGTPFTIVVRMASPPSDEWMIYLQGGVLCDDYAFPCDERELRLTTTLPLPDRGMGPVPFGGLLSSDPTVNPDFHDANQVLAQYCSSDFWAGATTERRPTSGDPAQGWYFSGHAVVDGMLGILAERYGLDDGRAGLRVLFAGGSAGAFGAHFNVARVAAALPSTAGDGRLMLLVDAGWMTDWDDPLYRFGAATTPDHDVWTRARAFWGATFDPTCEAQEADPVDCLFGPGWYPHVSGQWPTFVQQSVIDSSFMGTHGILAGDTAGIDAWRAEAEPSLAPVTWLFSGDQLYHVLGLVDAGLDTGPAGSTLRETLGRFWNGGAPERVIF